MILFPNAKINIGLNIVERRDDGYHNIETIMYPINWRDILEIVPAKGNLTTLTVTGRKIDCDVEKNLVMKAFRLFQKETGIGNVDIYLRKIIPDGAGLGGGSADAAYTLVGLNRLFNCGLPNETLADMAAQLGADCPFFIYNTPKLATGIGTEFADIDINLSGYQIAVVKPATSVPTSKAYAGVVPHKPEYDLVTIASQPADKWQGKMRNDFEESVFKTFPEIEQIKMRLTDMNATYTSMSGSGAAVYAIFRDCDILAERIAQIFPDCDTFTDIL